MLNSKQRAYLRGLANNIDTILFVGKDKINHGVISQARDAINSRELVKGKVLENADLKVKDVAENLAQEIRAEVVSVIGSKFILYKKNTKNSKIELPKTKKKKANE